VPTRYPYHSLEDFLATNMLTVDAQLDDGWGAPFPVKGREIQATVLFADVSGFSARTADLDPTETLTFVNHFFAWITAEAVHGRSGIVDKYIGDEIMVVYSKEFGSDDPFLDAVQTGRWMGEHDVFAFVPHIGVASGTVIVGYVGTPLKYNCSVFGAPVALAARCAGVASDYDGPTSACITFQAAEWHGRDFDQMLPAIQYAEPDGYEKPHGWELLDPRTAELKNLATTSIRQIVRTALWLPNQTAEERAREAVRVIEAAGRRWRSLPSASPSAD
jgi:class 3 adenylate cyclase